MTTSDEERLFKLVEAASGQERLYANVGKIASNWATFEHLLHSCLWVLAKVEDEAGACLTAQIPNIARALDAFSALVHLRGGTPGLIAKINKFAEKTQSLNLRRNRTVHDSWNWDMETGKPNRLQISAQKRLVFGFKQTEVIELSKLVDDIADHIEAFDRLGAEVSDQLGSSAGLTFRRPT